jgi:hypothetical protein
MQYVGSGIIATATPTQSTELVELVPTTIDNFKKIVFKNSNVCTIKVNGSDPIYLAANQGFSTEIGELLISSFVIVEADISYTFYATY